MKEPGLMLIALQGWMMGEHVFNEAALTPFC